MALRHPNAIDLAAWFDGEGDRETGDHIAGCERCTRHVDELKRLRSHVRSAPLPDSLERPPANLPPSAAGSRASGAPALRRLAPLLVVVLFVLLIVLIVVLGGR